MSLYLITHAHTRQQPELDAREWCLSPQGEAQARALAGQPFWSQVTGLLLSSEVKTRLTAAPLLAERQLPVTVDDRLDELRRGEWCLDYRSRVAQAFAVPHRSAGGWEPANQALARFQAAVADAFHARPGCSLALIGHGLVLSLYRASLLGRDRVRPADWEQLPFAAVAVADPVDGRWLADFSPVLPGDGAAR